jgi:Rod binding domain-containing protein
VSGTDFLITAPAIAQQSQAEAKTTQALRILQSKPANSAKIEKAAHDFESILLGEWLQQAEKSFATVPGSDPNKDADPGHDQFQSIGCEYLAGALSKAGGIGLAAMITKHLKAAVGDASKPAGPDHQSTQGNHAGAATAASAHSQLTDKP